MIMRKFRIENVNYSLNNMRHYFMDNYPNTVHMYLIRDWYKVYNEDAEIVSDIFGYKMFDDNYSPYLGNICCGFPKRIIDKVKLGLEKNNINFTIINTEDYSYTYYDYLEENNYKGYYDGIESTLDEEEIPEVKTDKIDEKQFEEINERISYSKNKYEVQQPPKREYYKNYYTPMKEDTYNHVDFQNKEYVKIGDTVTILNTKTGEEEKYTIHKTYHDYKPSSMTGEPGKGYDIISYKDELLNTSDIDNGIILSESEFAQRLIGSYLGSTLQLIDDDLNEVKYIIKDIKKH